MTHSIVKTSAYISAIVLAGCDVFTGFSRSAPLKEVPSKQCVLSVLEASPGIKSVSYSADGITDSGAAIKHRYWYNVKLDGLGGDLSFLVLEDGSLTYRNAIVRAYGDMDDEAERELHALVVDIEKQLSSECGMTFEDALVKQTCFRATPRCVKSGRFISL